MSRWVSLVIVLAVGVACAMQPQAHKSVPVCQILVIPPGAGVPVLWTCTGGVAHGRVACVLGCPVGEPEWTPVEGGLCVRSCVTCTPAEEVARNPHAKCSAWGGDDDEPDMGPVDMLR
jgi:hypothetical protein